MQDSGLQTVDLIIYVRACFKEEDTRMSVVYTNLVLNEVQQFNALNVMCSLSGT